jgi:hypothetical protein
MIELKADSQAIERAESALAQQLADMNNFELVRALVDAGKPVSFHIGLSELKRVASIYRASVASYKDCLRQYLEDTIKPCTHDWTCALHYDFDAWQRNWMVVIVKPVQPRANTRLESTSPPQPKAWNEIAHQRPWR